MNLLEKTISFLVLIVISQHTIAQTSENTTEAQPFWPQRSSEELVVAPSPEVGSLPSWKGVDVDLATGQGHLAFPLLEWTVGDYPVKVGLSYRIGAFRTEELPGWIGLGWNLTGLGAVSRSVMGQPDEKLPVKILTTDQIDNAADAVDYLTDIEDLRIDTSLDRYRYTLPGGESGEFVLQGNKIIQLPKSDIVIERIGAIVDKVNDFKVTTPDGVQYEFCEREYSEYSYTPEVIDNLYRSPNYRAVTTWYLSKIITAEGADTIKIEYTTIPSITRSHKTNPYTISMRDDMSGGKQIEWLHDSSLGTRGLSTNATFFPQPKILLRITSRTATLQADYIEASYSKYLSSLTLQNYDGDIVKVVDLTRYSASNKHLRSFSVKAADGKKIDGCEFSYNEREVHNIGDFFGYPNSRSGAPYALTSIVYHDTGKFNPRRRYDFSYVTAGVLTQTVSASGVTTEYEYEPNAIPIEKPTTRKSGQRSFWIPDTAIIDIKPYYPIEPDSTIMQNPEDPDSLIAIGIRIKSITSTDTPTGRKIKREFSYADGMSNIDFAFLKWRDFVGLSGMKWFYTYATMDIATVYDTSASLLTGSRLPGVRPEEASIFYGKVTENVSGTGLESPLRTEYRFDLSRCRLAMITGGKEMKIPFANVSNDYRSLVPRTHPTYGPKIYPDYFMSSTIWHYWREHIGAIPELKEIIHYRRDGNRYLPEESVCRYYSTVDSTSLSVSLHSEPMVRRVRNMTTLAISRDYKTTEDLSYFNVKLEATSRRLDSVLTVRYFPDGSQQAESHSIAYSGMPGVIALPSGRPVIDSVDISKPVLPDHPVWGGDSINELAAPRLPYIETFRRGGHTMQRRTLYSSMMSGGFYKEASNRGLKTLPVAEMWVMDGCDTLLRRYNYGRYPTAAGTGNMLTRPSLISTAINGAIVDRQHIGGYSPHGHPASVEQTGKPTTHYGWGYDGDLLTYRLYIPPMLQVADSPNQNRANVENQLDFGLCWKFEYKPLIGCIGIVNPSGKSTSYNYAGNRMCEVRNTSNSLVASYDYEIFSDTPAINSGANRISTTTYHSSISSGATVSKWHDGFGHVVAEVSEGFGCDGEDVASLTFRDAIGRPISSWLPLTLSTADIPNMLKREQSVRNLAASVHADNEAVRRMTYAGNSSEMPLTATIGGSDYAAHPQQSELTCSNPANPIRRVRRWRWDNMTLSADGYYAAGELTAVKTIDGDGRTTIVFVDCLGATVLSRRIADSGEFADTYTVSNLWGNPLIVIPPELSRQLCEGNVNSRRMAELIDLYAYVYRYDRQQRLRSKKLPGCEPITYAYDSEERIAFTRDGNLAQRGRRSFILYDAYGRTAITGTCSDALNEAEWNEVTLPHDCIRKTDSTYGDASTFLGSGYIISDALAEKLTDAELLNTTYYDDYSFIPVERQSSIMNHRPSTANSSPRGLTTGTLSAVLADGQTKPVTSITFYDMEDRAMTIVSDSHVNDKDLAVTHYNYTYSGLVSSVADKFIGNGSTRYALSNIYLYDNNGRQKSLRRQLSIDNSVNFGFRPPRPDLQNKSAAAGGLQPRPEPPEPPKAFGTISFGYDSFGRLDAVKMSDIFSHTYEYDMHGWQTRWVTPYIEQQLHYHDGVNPAYTGRISAKATTYNGEVNRYDYQYDQLGRLNAAHYSGLSPTDFSTAYDYDLQGNMLRLKRNGLFGPGIYETVDDVTATYQGNQLKTLCEAADDVMLESSLDVRAGDYGEDAFAYDANGNQCRDMSRGVADVEYNLLNLPQKVTMEDGSIISYIYTASGTKLAEIISNADGETLSRRDWVGNLEFANRIPERLRLPDGYITLADTTYHAFIPDYQGNIVGVYNTATDDLEQLTDYYPYGLPLATSSNPTANRTKFGAKDLTTDQGLNLYDFAARWHNPAFPQITTPDPCAEDYKPLSPYIFCANDPINFIDPTGMDIWHVYPNGEMYLFEENTDYERIYLVDYDGNEMIDEIGSPKYTEYSYGSVTYRTVPIDGKRHYDVITIRGDDDATELFEFLSENITGSNLEIEFGLTRTGLEGKLGLNFITTSHENRKENGFNKLYNGQLAYGYYVREFIHSHPEGYNASKEDFNIAKLTNKLQGHKVIFKVFHVPTKSYNLFYP